MRAKPTRRRRRGVFGAVLGILQDPQAVVMTWTLKLLLAGSFVAIVAIESRAYLDEAGGGTPPRVAAAPGAIARIAGTVAGRGRADGRPVRRAAGRLQAASERARLQ